MARNMITGKETQKMQEFTQEQIDRAEHMGIEIPADVKEQIFEYANQKIYFPDGRGYIDLQSCFVNGNFI